MTIRPIGRLQWAVQSETYAHIEYHTDLEEMTCTCPRFIEGKSFCKHLNFILSLSDSKAPPATLNSFEFLP